MRTTLYDTHAGLGATFTDFAGYEMPVHYGSIKAEHAAVRAAVGRFDVSHMSTLWVRDADEALAKVTPTDTSRIAVGRCKYTVLLREDGSILDDTILFRTSRDEWMVVPNAGRNKDAAAHIAAAGAEVEDATHRTAIIALQGPVAAAAFKKATGQVMPRPFTVTDTKIAGHPAWVSGTGYTGETGCELFLDAEAAVDAWEALEAAPIGLGARDTLRLEKGYCLAGNEFSGGRTPLEAGLSWLIDWDVDFLGKDALLQQKKDGHARLHGLLMPKGIPRAGYSVARDGRPLGSVTSGTLSPTLGKGIALAYLRGAKPGQTVEVDVRGRAHEAEVVKPPFC